MGANGARGAFRLDQETLARDRAPEAFVAAHTVQARPPLVPEIALRLAAEPYAIWQAADVVLHARPFWAFAWPGGQALARYLLDRPSLVKGRTVLDLGCGSGLLGIAAMRAGAASCLAADIDPVALAATRLNTRLAGVTIATTGDNLLATPSGPRAIGPWNLILIGDVTYEAGLARAVERFVRSAVAAGAMVLFADRTTSATLLARAPAVAEYDVTVFPVLEEEAMERARVWQIGG